MVTGEITCEPITWLLERVSGARAASIAVLIYASSPIVVYFGLGWFDPLAVLCLLGGLFFLLRKEAVPAGVVVGLGILVKLFPGAVILAAPLLLSWRQSLRFAAALVLTLVAVLVPTALLGSDMLLASFGSMITRQPWETISALLSGTYVFGHVSTDRFVATGP
jgi:Gpi18-like mannosyltransferase